MPKKWTAKRFYTKYKSGERSTLEKKVLDRLKSDGIFAAYEPGRIPYTVPERQTKYLPDVILPNGLIIEVKGWPFEAAARTKHLLIKAQYPQLDLRFVFSSPQSPIYKGSNTSWAGWAKFHGFQWAKGVIPKSWTKEPENHWNIQFLKACGIELPGWENY